MELTVQLAYIAAMPFQWIGKVAQSLGGASKVGAWGKMTLTGKAKNAPPAKFADAHVYFVDAEFFLDLM